MLAAPDIVKARQRQASCEKALPLKGPKQVQPTNSWLESKQIQSALDERKAILEEQRVEKRNHLSVVEWREELGLGLVTRRVGNEWEAFGHESECKLWIYPEEALYLLETNSIEILLEDVPMSIEQGYAILLSPHSSCTLEEYRTFSHLKCNGCNVRRHSPSVVTTRYEKQLRLDQYQHGMKNSIKGPRGSDSSDRRASQECKIREQDVICVQGIPEMLMEDDEPVPSENIVREAKQVGTESEQLNSFGIPENSISPKTGGVMEKAEMNESSAHLPGQIENMEIEVSDDSDDGLQVDTFPKMGSESEMKSSECTSQQNVSDELKASNMPSSNFSPSSDSNDVTDEEVKCRFDNVVSEDASKCSADVNCELQLPDTTESNELELVTESNGESLVNTNVNLQQKHSGEDVPSNKQSEDKDMIHTDEVVGSSEQHQVTVSQFGANEIVNSDRPDDISTMMSNTVSLQEEETGNRQDQDEDDACMPPSENIPKDSLQEIETVDINKSPHSTTVTLDVVDGSSAHSSHESCEVNTVDSDDDNSSIILISEGLNTHSEVTINDTDNESDDEVVVDTDDDDDDDEEEDEEEEDEDEEDEDDDDDDSDCMEIPCENVELNGTQSRKRKHASTADDPLPKRRIIATVDLSDEEVEVIETPVEDSVTHNVPRIRPPSAWNSALLQDLERTRILNSIVNVANKFNIKINIPAEKYLPEGVRPIKQESHLSLSSLNLIGLGGKPDRQYKSAYEVIKENGDMTIGIPDIFCDDILAAAYPNHMVPVVWAEISVAERKHYLHLPYRTLFPLNHPRFQQIVPCGNAPFPRPSFPQRSLCGIIPVQKPLPRPISGASGSWFQSNNWHSTPNMRNDVNYAPKVRVKQESKHGILKHGWNNMSIKTEGEDVKPSLLGMHPLQALFRTGTIDSSINGQNHSGQSASGGFDTIPSLLHLSTSQDIKPRIARVEALRKLNEIARQLFTFMSPQQKIFVIDENDETVYLSKDQKEIEFMLSSVGTKLLCERLGLNDVSIGKKKLRLQKKWARHYLQILLNQIKLGTIEHLGTNSDGNLCTNIQPSFPGINCEADSERLQDEQQVLRSSHALSKDINGVSVELHASVCVKSEPQSSEAGVSINQECRPLQSTSALSQIPSASEAVAKPRLQEAVAEVDNSLAQSEPEPTMGTSHSQASSNAIGGTSTTRSLTTSDVLESTLVEPEHSASPGVYEKQLEERIPSSDAVPSDENINMVDDSSPFEEDRSTINVIALEEVRAMDVDGAPSNLDAGASEPTVTQDLYSAVKQDSTISVCTMEEVEAMDVDAALSSLDAGASKLRVTQELCSAVKQGGEEESKEEVEPLLKPSDCTTLDNVLSCLTIIKPAVLEEIKSIPPKKNLSISFDLYLPSTTFRKSSPCLPNFRVVVLRGGDPIPQSGEIAALTRKYQDDVLILYAVVQSCSINFYLLNKVQLPPIPVNMTELNS